MLYRWVFDSAVLVASTSEYPTVVLLLYVSVRLLCYIDFFFLMIRRPPRSALDRSSAASDVYKRQAIGMGKVQLPGAAADGMKFVAPVVIERIMGAYRTCLLYTSPSPRDRTRSRMPSSA